MRKVSQKTMRAVQNRPDVCERWEMFHDHDCAGRITWEHALIYAGRQIDDPKAIVKICAFSHGIDEFQDSNCLDKDKNQYIALGRFTKEDFDKYPNSDFRQRFKYLHTRFGNFIN